MAKSYPLEVAVSRHAREVPATPAHGKDAAPSLNSKAVLPQPTWMFKSINRSRQILLVNRSRKL